MQLGSSAASAAVLVVNAVGSGINAVKSTWTGNKVKKIHVVYCQSSAVAKHITALALAQKVGNQVVGAGWGAICTVKWTTLKFFSFVALPQYFFSKYVYRTIFGDRCGGGSGGSWLGNAGGCGRLLGR